ncbi:MAG: hypothetical protein LBR10_03955 [Prevotellaceae bacterium]|jgi:hypothetical protein|nr:hypothetical protein [Prevotellaceae bacterium]
MNDKVKYILDKLKTLDLEKEPVEDAKALIKELRWFPVLAYTLGPGHAIMRARTGSGYSYVGDLTYPPHHKTKIGRANTKAKPMFYGTVVPADAQIDDPIYSAQLAALCEVSDLLKGYCNAENTEKITFSRWAVLEPITFLFIVPNEKLNELDPISKKLKAAHQKFVEQQQTDSMENFVQITRFFADEFSKNVQHNHEYLYLLSAVYSEVLTEKDNIDGVIYRSVITKGNFGFNVAIKPIVADNCLMMDYVGEFQLRKENNDFYCELDKRCIPLYTHQTCFTFG